MEILNKFKSNFKDNYSQDSDKFISLLNESKLMNLDIKKIIIGIEDINEEIGNIHVGSDETDELVLKINRENIRIGDYEVQIAKDNKKLIKIQESIVEVEKNIVESLKEISVEVLV